MLLFMEDCQLPMYPTAAVTPDNYQWFLHIEFLIKLQSWVSLKVVLVKSFII